MQRQIDPPAAVQSGADAADDVAQAVLMGTQHRLSFASAAMAIRGREVGKSVHNRADLALPQTALPKRGGACHAPAHNQGMSSAVAPASQALFLNITL